MFPVKHIEAGELPVKKELTVRFPYDESTQIVKKIVADCDCTQFYNDAVNREIVVKYTSAGIPKHLAHRGWYVTTKTLTTYTEEVFTDSQTKEETTELTFTVKITTT